MKPLRGAITLVNFAHRDYPLSNTSSHYIDDIIQEAAEYLMLSKKINYYTNPVNQCNIITAIDGTWQNIKYADDFVESVEIDFVSMRWCDRDMNVSARPAPIHLYSSVSFLHGKYFNPSPFITAFWSKDPKKAPHFFIPRVFY